MHDKAYLSKINQGGQFLQNLLHFTRLLRELDIAVSGNQILGLTEAIHLIDISTKEDFYNTSRSFLLNDISKREKFDLAFDLFWSGYIAGYLEFAGSGQPPPREVLDNINPDALPEKISGVLLDSTLVEAGDQQFSEKSDLQIRPFYSPHDILQQKDFGLYDAEDLRQAKMLIKKAGLFRIQKRTRRKIQSGKKSKFLDFQRTLRNNLNTCGELIDLDWHQTKYKSRPVIVLCDISGSMEQYSLVFLHLLYALVQDTTRIETFVFATRLTRMTMLLRNNSPHQVLENLSAQVPDWSGGTRIGASLRTFNYCWSRRVRCPGSIVLIISDGWDRGDTNLLRKEVSRLSRTAHRLYWLNPLAAGEEYQPLVKGIQAVSPYVDVTLPLATLINLESVVNKLANLN